MNLVKKKVLLMLYKKAQNCIQFTWGTYNEKVFFPLFTENLSCPSVQYMMWESSKKRCFLVKNEHLIKNGQQWPRWGQKKLCSCIWTISWVILLVQTCPNLSKLVQTCPNLFTFEPKMKNMYMGVFSTQFFPLNLIFKSKMIQGD